MSTYSLSMSTFMLYVNMWDKYDAMYLISVEVQNKYVNIQFIYVDIQVFILLTCYIFMSIYTNNLCQQENMQDKNVDIILIRYWNEI